MVPSGGTLPVGLSKPDRPRWGAARRGRLWGGVGGSGGAPALSLVNGLVALFEDADGKGVDVRQHPLQRVKHRGRGCEKPHVFFRRVVAEPIRAGHVDAHIRPVA